MTTARTPFARLSDCYDELDEKGYVLKYDKQNETLFYVKPEKTEERVPLEMNVLRGHTREIAVENHNLHFFDHDDKWVVATLPEEQCEGRFL